MFDIELIVSPFENKKLLKERWEVWRGNPILYLPILLWQFPDLRSVGMERQEFFKNFVDLLIALQLSQEGILGWIEERFCSFWKHHV